MGKNPDIPPEVRAQIKILRQANGWSGARIAREVNVSPRAVNRFLANPDRQSGRRRCGGRLILTDAHRRRIKGLATRKKMSATQIKAHLGYTASVRTIQQSLSSDPNIKWRKMAIKPPLTRTHKQNRLRFALEHVHWTTEWTKVVFSDEKKLNLDGPDGLRYYWHDLRQEKEVMSKRGFGGGSVMVWGAFGYFGKTDIVPLRGAQNSLKYQDTLADHLLPSGPLIADHPWIFQQDRAAIHVSGSTIGWFEANEVTLLDWPSRSPDLNPIENLWGWLARMVYRNGRQFEDTHQLQSAIEEAWLSVPLALLQSLVESMATRLKALLMAKGGPTKY